VSFFKSLVERMLGRSGSPGGSGDDWREAFAITFSGMVLDKPSVATLMESLPSDSRKALTASPDDKIEALAFDLWLVSHALRRSVRHISKPELASLLDAGHLEVYRQLLAGGMPEAQIMALQGCLAQRYAEYDDAYAGFWARKRDWMLPFARLVTSRIFGREIGDIQVASTLALVVVNPTVLSIAQSFGDFRPPAR
jgi:hypothetical protein